MLHFCEIWPCVLLPFLCFSSEECVPEFQESSEPTAQNKPIATMKAYGRGRPVLSLNLECQYTEIRSRTRRCEYSYGGSNYAKMAVRKYSADLCLNFLSCAICRCVCFLDRQFRFHCFINSGFTWANIDFTVYIGGYALRFLQRPALLRARFLTAAPIALLPAGFLLMDVIVSGVLRPRAPRNFAPNDKQKSQKSLRCECNDAAQRGQESGGKAARQF